MKSSDFYGGCLIGFIVASAAFGSVIIAMNAQYKQDLIERGAAKYNETTGVLEWIDRAEVAK